MSHVLYSLTWFDIYIVYLYINREIQFCFKLFTQMHLMRTCFFDFCRGWQGILAYGCQNIVTVVDPKSMQVIQGLDKHKGYIVKVCFHFFL